MLGYVWYGFGPGSLRSQVKSVQDYFCPRSFLVVSVPSQYGPWVVLTPGQLSPVSFRFRSVSVPGYFGLNSFSHGSFRSRVILFPWQLVLNHFGPRLFQQRVFSVPGHFCSELFWSCSFSRLGFSIYSLDRLCAQ